MESPIFGHLRPGAAPDPDEPPNPYLDGGTRSLGEPMSLLEREAAVILWRQLKARRGDPDPDAPPPRPPRRWGSRARGYTG